MELTKQQELAFIKAEQEYGNELTLEYDSAGLMNVFIDGYTTGFDNAITLSIQIMKNLHFNEEDIEYFCKYLDLNKIY